MPPTVPAKFYNITDTLLKTLNNFHQLLDKAGGIHYIADRNKAHPSHWGRRKGRRQALLNSGKREKSESHFSLMSEFFLSCT